LPTQFARARRWRGRSPELYAESLDRPRDILYVLCSQILEGEIELVEDLIPDTLAHADPAWVRQCLQAGRDVYAVAEDVVTVDDDVTDVNPNAKVNALVR